LDITMLPEPWLFSINHKSGDIWFFAKYLQATTLEIVIP